MRKSYLTLAAVALVMASCSNEVLIDDIKSGDTDVAIGFSTFSDKATKGDTGVNTNLEYYHSSFAVYGTKKSTVTNNVGSVFDATATAYTPDETQQNGTGEWKYAIPRYWDKQANYNFIAVAPSAAIVKYSIATDKEVGDDANDFVTVDEGCTLVGQNLQATATTAEIVKGFIGGSGKDTDIMTSAKASQAGSEVTGTTVVNLTYKHILAKLNVTVAKAMVLNDATVKVKSIEITGLDDKGTYSEKAYVAPGTYKQAAGTYVAGTTYYTTNTGAQKVDATSFVAGTTDVSTYFVDAQKSGWTSSASGATYSLKYEAASSATDNELADATSATATVPSYFIESLVMPQGVSAEKLTLVYEITTGTGSDAHTEEFAYNMDLNKAFTSFMDRNNYTLKFTIEPLVIKFDATATLWADQPAKEITINN